MKRFLILAMIIGFVFSFVAQAAAVTFQARGDWRVHFNYVENPRFNKDFKDDKFQAMQRMRTSFEFIASENLRGVLRITTDNVRWGERAATGQFDVGETVSLGFDQAYIEYYVPSTKINVKAGLQTVVLPNTLGSHILDSEEYGVVASTPVNQKLGLTLGWLRVNDKRERWDLGGGNFEKSRDEVDLLFTVAPFTLEGLQINPFLAYARAGKYAPISYTDFYGNNPFWVDASGFNWKQMNVFWAGINMTLNRFDPWVVNADFNYGQSSRYLSYTEPDNIYLVGDKIGETAGWIASLSVACKMDMMTPELFFLYESGESRTSLRGDKKGRRMPALTPRLTMSSFAFNGSNFGSDPGHAAGQVPAFTQRSAMNMLRTTGMWAAGFRLGDISLMDRVSHDFLLAYYRGTNHKDYLDEEVGNQVFTTRDYLWEINFDTTYQMYDNLAAILELGYINVNRASRTNNGDPVDVPGDNSWKAAFGFRYQF
ncbi:outer membrane homotrimeric porin [Desulfonatronovibrio hydrogenovorans]|uniref:outer membrane homotrimeric porin n=1 Tax=Desulfonatronovibrio hydrogenovorans TaxID=53245 RepID=UPI00048DA605|nr:outer membrane homotrimeric porin [Desulfonatronovibrio hydrogenovorans]